MRRNKGKLIAVWVPGNHGAGGSTVANSLGITLQHITERKTLLVNMGSPRNYMEHYMKNDADMRFSMDYLKSFESDMSAELINTYASPINEKLFILPNSKITGDVSKTSTGYNQLFLEKALEAFEIVVIDIEAGINKENQQLLDMSDVIVAVMNDNEIMLQELLERNPSIRNYINGEKTYTVFNAIHGEKAGVRAIKELNKSLDLHCSYGISYDVEGRRAASSEGKFYSYLKQALGKKKREPILAEQLKDIGYSILEKLLSPEERYRENPPSRSMIFGRWKQWGGADA